MSDLAETLSPSGQNFNARKLSKAQGSEIDYSTLDGENDNRGFHSVSNPLVYSAAQTLIDYYRTYQKPVKLEAFDIPHDALISIAEQLDELGTAQIVKDTLLQALKDYVMSKGGSFARAANAKPIFIALNVADKKPAFKFDDGVTEMAAINGTSAQIEGASAVNVRLTATGTAMTSNAADVDKMFANAKGDKLWIQFEAPTKVALDGYLGEQQVVMAAVGEAMGGAMSAGELKEILQQLKDENLLNPEIIALLESMIEMRVLAEAGLTPETEARVAELSEKIAELIEQGLESGAIPSSFASGAVQSIQSLVETYGMQDVIPAEAIQSLETKIQVAELTEKLESVIADMDKETDADTIAALEEMIESIQGLEGQELLDVLADMPDALAELPIPQAVAEKLADLVQAVENVSADVQARLPEPDPLQDMANLAADDIAALLQTLDSLDDLPPQLAELVAQLETAGVDIAALSAEQVADALAGKGDPQIAEVVRDIVITLNNPEVQAALPQTLLNEVNVVLRDHGDLVQTITVQNVIQSLNEQLNSGNLTAEQVETVKETIAKLESGETLKTLDTAQLAAIAQVVEGPAAAQIQTVVQVIENTQADNVVLANESVEKISVLVTDMDAVQDALQSIENPTPEQAELIEKIESVIETLKADPANIQALAELQSLDTSAIADVLPPETATALQNVVERVTQSAPEIAAIQETALAIKHDVTPADIRNTAEVIVALNTNTQDFKAAGVDIDVIKETLNTNITSAQSLSELAKVQDALVNASPDTAAAVRALVETQITAVSESTGIDRPTVEQAVAVVTTLSSEISGNDTLKQALMESGVNVDKIVSELGQTESLSEAAKIIAAVQTSPEVMAALPPQMVESVKAVVQANADVIADRIVADSPSLNIAEVKAAVIQASEIAAVAAVDPVARENLQAAGIDPANVERIVTNISSPEGLTEIAKLATVTTLPPEVAAKVKAVMTVAAETVAVKIVSNNSGLDVQSVKATILDTARLSVVAEQSPALRQALEQAGIEPARIDTILQDLKNPASVSAIAAIETIRQAGPQAIAAVETKGVDIARISTEQIQIQAAHLNIEPQTLQSVITASAALSTPAVAEAASRAGIDIESVKNAIQANPASAEALKTVMDIKDSMPADVKKDIATLETRIIAEAATRLGVESSQLRDMITSSPEARAQIIQTLAAVEKTPDTPAPISRIESQVLATRLADVVTNNALPPAQERQVQAIINKIESGQPVSVKDMVALQTSVALAPAQVQTAVQNAFDGAKVTLPKTELPVRNVASIVQPQEFQRTVSNDAMSSELKAIASVISKDAGAGSRQLTASEKIQVQTITTAAKALSTLGEKPLPPAQAIAILTQLDTARVKLDGNPQLQQQIQQIREQIIQKVTAGTDIKAEEVRDQGCTTCKNKNCDSCGPQFKEARSKGHVVSIQTTVDRVLGQQKGTPDAANETQTQPFRPAETSMQLRDIVSDMRTAEAGQRMGAREKVSAEALSTAAHLLRGAQDGQKLSSVEAEIILRKLDDGVKGVPNPVVQQQIQEIREQVFKSVDGGPEALPEDLRSGKCVGCAGGSCVDCGNGFDKAKREGLVVSAEATVDKVLGKMDAELKDVQDTKTEKPQKIGCATPCGGNCGDCKTNFENSAIPPEDTVDKVLNGKGANADSNADAASKKQGGQHRKFDMAA